MIIRMAIGAVLGAVVGYVIMYKLIGCTTGTCPIMRNPYTSTIYGAIIGLLLAGGV
jgi:hypothetical protein